MEYLIIIFFLKPIGLITGGYNNLGKAFVKGLGTQDLNAAFLLKDLL